MDLDAKVVDLVDCRHLISQITQVKVKHCYREANYYADAFARLGTMLSFDFLYFSFPSPNLFNVHVSNLYSLYHPRLCPGPVVPSLF